MPCPPPGDLPNPGINPGLLHCRPILYHLSHQGSPRILEWVAYPFSRELPDPGIKPGSPASQADSLLAELPGKGRSFKMRVVGSGWVIKNFLSDLIFTSPHVLPFIMKRFLMHDDINQFMVLKLTKKELSFSTSNFQLLIFYYKKS